MRLRAERERNQARKRDKDDQKTRSHSLLIPLIQVSR